MASKSSHKRLVREFKTISENPPPFITAHPSEHNILEWHYILTGPPDTPYAGGQYWGTLIFPPEYPFAPPAIRMHTPSGRFQPSTRLCLSISDFHPKSFNPAWEVSTILLGVQSFMTGEEMTTGSVSATEAERKWHAARSRWWNSTGGGTHGRLAAGVNPSAKGIGAIASGDGGYKFRAEWQEVDEENWKWIKENKIETRTGKVAVDSEHDCSPQTAALRRQLAGATSGLGEAVQTGQAARQAGQGFAARNKFWILGTLVFVYVLLARVLGGDD